MQHHRSSPINQDLISRLPDEVIVCILSLLTMKEAARTSILSHRWIDLWKFYNGELDFDGSNTLVQLKQEGELSGAKVAWYISWVDQVINSNKGPDIEKFRIRYDMKNHHKNVIDRWIKFAMAKRVKKFELNLCTFLGGHGEENYSFPCSLLSPLAFSNFNNLTGVCLAAVDVTDEVIAHFLANCGLLEQLVVRDAFSLVNLKICSHSLRFLEVSACINLNTVGISARELQCFKFMGHHTTSIGYDDVPSLKIVSLGGYYTEYILERFNQYTLFLFQVKILALEMNYLVANMGLLFTRGFPPLRNVRQLELEVVVRPDQGILHLYSLVVAAVLLEKLVVKFEISKWAGSKPSYDFVYEDKRKKTWGLGKHNAQPNGPNLKIVEFVGWHGMKVDYEFSLFIIEHVVVQKVIINPRNPRAFERLWLSSSLEKEEEIEDVARERARLLGKKLPPGVELVVL